MNEEQSKNISKFLSYVLRHQPQSINLQLDENGWAIIEELIAKSNSKLNWELLEHIVKTNSKKRFEFNDDHTKIRASQGHSITIDLELKVSVPPQVLYHGTVAKYIDAIKREGLLKMNRQHVHLSKDVTTANEVALRRGKPIILTIETAELLKEGFPFYISANGVWLIEHVPVRFITF